MPNRDRALLRVPAGSHVKPPGEASCRTVAGCVARFEPAGPSESARNRSSDEKTTALVLLSAAGRPLLDGPALPRAIADLAMPPMTAAATSTPTSAKRTARFGNARPRRTLNSFTLFLPFG